MVSCIKIWSSYFNNFNKCLVMIENINLKSDYFACNIFIFWCFKYFVVNLLPCSGHWRGLADDDGAAGGIVRPSNNFLFLTHFEDQKHISPISNILHHSKIHFTNQKHNQNKVFVILFIVRLFGGSDSLKESLLSVLGRIFLSRVSFDLCLIWSREKMFQEGGKKPLKIWRRGK